MKKLVLLSALLISATSLSANVDIEMAKKDITTYNARIAQVENERIFKRGQRTCPKCLYSQIAGLAAIAMYTRGLLEAAAIKAFPALLPEILLGRPKGQSGIMRYFWAPEGRHPREWSKIGSLALWGTIGASGIYAAYNLAQEVYNDYKINRYIAGLEETRNKRTEIVETLDPSFKKEEL